MGKSLRLEPETMERCVSLCNTMISKLDRAIRDSAQLTNASGFGDLASARQLQQGFINKARGNPDSVYERMVQFKAAIILMRDAFAAGGEGFADADSAISQAFGTISNGIDA